MTEKVSAVDYEARAEIRALGQEVKSIAEAMNAGFLRTGAQIERLIEFQANGSKVNYGTWISAIGLIVTLIVLIATPFAFNLNRVEVASTSLSEKFLEHVRDGHPRRVEAQVQTNGKRIDELHLLIQRRTEELERRERELADLRERALVKELAGYDRRLETVENWQRSNNIKSSERHARSEARLDASEARIAATAWSARTQKN